VRIPCDAPGNEYDPSTLVVVLSVGSGRPDGRIWLREISQPFSGVSDPLWSRTPFTSPSAFSTTSMGTV
jgi:hypothetical protein